MKRFLSVVTLLAFCASTALAGSALERNWQGLGTLRNARFVYVTSYDGPQFSRNILPEDRAAISRVQNAVRDWGYTVVYRPQQADMILAVQSRGSDDTLAVYSRGFSHYLWRASQKGGFSAETSTLLDELKTDLDRAKGARGEE